MKTIGAKAIIVVIPLVAILALGALLAVGASDPTVSRVGPAARTCVGSASA